MYDVEALLKVQWEQVEKPCQQEETKTGRGSKERVKVREGVLGLLPMHLQHRFKRAHCTVKGREGREGRNSA